MPSLAVKSPFVIFPILIKTVFLAALAAGEEGILKDFTNVPLEELGVKLVPEKKDPTTGFLVAGKNATSAISSLTELNGRAIIDLELDMRPGAASTEGFLGPNERLLDVLAADNKYVVEEQGQTHQELARHLRVLVALGKKQPAEEFLYHGRRFRAEFRSYRGYQDSPFQDGTKANSEVTIRNLTNGKTLAYSLLVPDMIERYGFYEGRGTPYRVAPKEILAVFDFLNKKPS
jgi:hypothetical protein